MSAWQQIEAEKAFGRAIRARRRAQVACRVRRSACRCHRLAIAAVSGRSGERGVREIPLDAIVATLEPNRAAQFDPAFRPARSARERWQRVWVAVARGIPLPPIDVVPAAGGYAVLDGHHRVSVARARGAVTIDAVVSAG
jgi:hypothetical protein